jgi:hypothetical protein
MMALFKKAVLFEKKNQKTFVPWACAAGEGRDSDIKVFCFFSSEKKAFLPIRRKTGANGGVGAQSRMITACADW